MRVLSLHMTKIIALLSAALLPTSASFAKDGASVLPDQELEMIVSGDGKTLFMLGPLAKGSYFKFAKALRSAPRAETVFLGSEGGLAMEGFLIGNLVRKHRLNSYVGHYCASACTFVFIAGKKRSASPSARLGFHQAYFIGEKGEVVPDPDGLAYAKDSLNAGQIKLRPAANSILGLTGNERITQLFGAPMFKMPLQKKCSLFSQRICGSRIIPNCEKRALLTPIFRKYRCRTIGVSRGRMSLGKMAGNPSLGCIWAGGASGI